MAILNSQIAFDFKFIILNLQKTSLLKYMVDRFFLRYKNMGCLCGSVG